MSRKRRREANDARATEEAAESPWKMDVGTLARRHVLSLVLFALVLIAYLPTLGGAYIWDDNQWLVSNRVVHDWDKLGLIWTDPTATPHYYPLVFTSFWIEHKMWGLGSMDAMGILRAPMGYHLTNMVLHGVAVLGLFAILRKLKLPGGEIGAWVAAALWAVHPVNVASVAWITERKNVLMAAFFMWSLYLVLKYLGVLEGRSGKSSTLGWALGLFLCAMLSKTTACVMPAVVLVLVWWKQGKMPARAWLATLPMFVIGLGLASMTAVMEKSHVGTIGPDWDFSLLQRAMIAGNALWFYVGKLVWPYPVLQIYPRWEIGAPSVWLWLGLVGAVVVPAGLLVLSRKIGRGAAAGVLVFIVAISPALGFISFYSQLFSFVADHYQYVASAAILVLLVEGLYGLLRWKAGAMKGSALLAAIGGGAVMVLAIMTLYYGILYRSDVTLWRFAAAHNPDNFMVQLNVGEALARRRNVVEAESAYMKAQELRPQDWRPYERLMGLYLNTGQLEKAEAMSKGAAERLPAFVVERRAKWMKYQREQLGAEDSLAAYPEIEMGRLLVERGRYRDAKVKYLEALRKYPDHPRVYFGLGTCVAAEGDFEAADGYFKESIQRDPGHGESYFYRGLVLRALGREAEAMTHLEAARKLAPEVVLRLMGAATQTQPGR